MRQNLLDEFRTRFPANPFTETTSEASELFVFEQNTQNCQGKIIPITCLATTPPIGLCLKLQNKILNNKISHICIDGDFIPYGQPQYDPANTEIGHKRPDCLVFDDARLIFVELKLEQEELTFGKEDTKWKKIIEGAKQILAFVEFLKNENFDLGLFQSEKIGIICMRFEPNFSTISRGNAARNSEILKISQQIGFLVKPCQVFDFE